MRYEEWIDLLKELEKSNKEDLLKKIIESDYNPNIKDHLEPKLENTIKIKFQTSIDKIIKNLDTIFYDVNNLDIYLVNFRKELGFIERLINTQHLSEEKKTELTVMLRTETENIYNILIKEANREDPTGLYAITIKNNRIKWSD